MKTVKINLKQTIALLAVFAGLIFIRLFFSSPETENEKYFFLNDGCSAVYEMYTKSVSRNSKEGNTESFSVEIKGKLHTRTFRIKNIFRQAMYLSEACVRINGNRIKSIEKSLENIFYTDMTPAGVMKNFQYNSGIDENDKDMITGLIRSFEIVLPQRRRRIYTIKQKDGLGLYLASYTRKSGTWHKKKIHYITGKNTSQSTTVLSSEISFIPDDSGCWLQDVRGKELVRTSLFKNIYTAETATSFYLTKIKKEPDSLLSELENADDLIRAMKTAATRLAGTDNSAKIHPGKISLLISRYNKNSLHETSLKIRKLLHRYPDLIKGIPGTIKNKSLMDRTVSELIKILGIIGNSHAQKALVLIASDTDFSEQNRFRAVLSFSDVEKPLVPEAENFLLGSFDSLCSGKDHPETVTSALLVAGAVSGNLRNEYPKSAAELNRKLISLLNISQVPEQKTTLLTSLGNSRAPENAGVIEGYMNDSEINVNLSAIKALGKFKDKKTTEILLNHLTDKQDEVISSAVLRSLSGRKISSDRLKTIGDFLLDSNSEDSRREAIKLLKNNSSKDCAEMKESIKQAIKKETSAQNTRLLIETYDLIR